MYPNIIHELITSKICQQYLKSYQFFDFVDFFFNYPKTCSQNLRIEKLFMQYPKTYSQN